MPQFPPWKRQLAAWTDAAQVRRSQLGEAVTDLASRAEDAGRALPESVVDLAERARTRLEQVPRAIVADLRRRVNVLDLATRHDVEAQSKLGRSRVSFVLKEFLEEQRDHDEALVKSLRAELQEELQSFAAAIDDDLFAVDGEPPADRASPRRPLDDLDDLLDDDDDELDLADHDGSRSATDV